MATGWRSIVVAAALSAQVPAAPTYTQDIKPILEARCTGCHQSGDIAPMSLRDYAEVRPWARAIRQAVLLKKMPPWGAEPNPAHAFRNDRSLTPSEVRTVVQWVDGGSAQGQPSPAPAMTLAAANADNSKPDIVIRVPGFAVPASGALPYSFLIVPLHLTHDTWVRMADFHVDQRQVIHHINAFVRPPGSSFLQGFPANEIFVPTVTDRAKRQAGEKVFDRRELLIGYEPGYRAEPWLKEGGKLIRAGSDVVFEMHYNPNGRATVDRSELRLYFSHETPAKRVLAIDTLRDLDLDIPAGDADYRSTTEMTLASPIQLLSVQPHMHYRGKSMRVEALRPDGEAEPLVDVPHYDFNWQTTYAYRALIDLPAGTRLRSIAVFDNSAANKFNPDASKEVHWGDQTTDEMHIAFLELVIPASADPEKLFEKAPRLLGDPQPTARSPAADRR